VPPPDPDLSGERLTLAGFLRARGGDVLAAWEARVRRFPAAAALGTPALRDHVPQILERLAEGMAVSTGALDEVAEDHAMARLTEGFDVGTVTAELTELRDVVLELWEAEGVGDIRVADARALDRAIDTILIRSVERFARARERTLVALDRVSAAALGTGDVETFLPRLLTVLLETTEAADSAFILLRDEDDVLRVRAASGNVADLGADFAIPVGEGFAGRIAQTCTPLLVRDAVTDPLVLNPGLKRGGVHAVYGVPLVYEGRAIGVAKMASRSAYDFSEDDQQLLRAMGQRATSIIVQSRLVAARERLAAALEHGDAFFLLDRDYRVVMVNSAQERLSRKPREETLGRVFWEIWPEAARPDSKYWTEYRRCMEEGVPVAFEEYYAPLDLWTSVTAYPVKDGIGVFFRDATERRRTTELVRRSEADLRRTFEVVPDMLCVVGYDDRFLQVNPAFSEILGFAEDELVGRPVIDFVHPEDRKRTREHKNALVTGERTRKYLTRLRHRSGEYRWLSWNATADTESRRIIAAARDVTDEKRRSEFEQQLIAIVSHDLRNPLNAILLGASAVLAREDVDDRTARSVGRIRSSAERAVRMIQDLLDFTRARVGSGIPLSRRRVDLGAVVRQVVDEMEVSHPDREILVQVKGPADGDWDADRLAQVLTNLVVNAVSYSPAGSPVGVAIRGTRDAAEVEIHNDGPTIPPEARDRLFEPFRRGDTGDRQGSLGLGLFIAREIVRAHEGTIEVRSADGDGTRFVVRLPRRGNAKK
jgi:PAS domain S-box-containing protein